MEKKLKDEMVEVMQFDDLEGQIDNYNQHAKALGFTEKQNVSKEGALEIFYQMVEDKMTDDEVADYVEILKKVTPVIKSAVETYMKLRLTYDIEEVL